MHFYKLWRDVSVLDKAEKDLLCSLFLLVYHKHSSTDNIAPTWPKGVIVHQEVDGTGVENASTVIYVSVFVNIKHFSVTK